MNDNCRRSCNPKKNCYAVVCKCCSVFSRTLKNVCKKKHKRHVFIKFTDNRQVFDFNFFYQAEKRKKRSYNRKNQTERKCCQRNISRKTYLKKRKQHAECYRNNT